MSNYSASAFSEDENSSWYKAYSYIKPKSEVLDIGCSSGAFGEVLIKNKNCIVDGVELDKGDIKKASKRLRKVYDLNIETADLSIINNRYDFLYFGDVIEHLVQPIETLKRVKTLLKPTGRVVFSIPNMSHLSVRLMLLSGKFAYGETGLLDKTHLHFYTYQEVQRVFSESGYKLIEHNPVLKDYPKQLVEEELNSVGLKLTPEFMNFLTNTEASVYQFVGVADPSKNQKQKSMKLDLVSPVDKFQTYLDETIHYYENIVKANQEHIAKQQKAIENQLSTIKVYRTELDRKSRQIDGLLSSRLVRMVAKTNKARKT